MVWARRGVEAGAGEVLLTSVDRDGTRKGMDVDLLRALAGVGVPVVASGGAGSAEHIGEAFDAGADAVAVGTLLHFGETVKSLKAALRERGVLVREAA